MEATVRMRVSNRRSSFGMKCVQCGNELLAPERSEYWSDKRTCHIWYAGNAVAVSTLWSCFLPRQVNEKYDDKRRYFPAAAGRIGSSRGAVTRLSDQNVAQLDALWQGRLLACLRHGRLDKAHGV